MEMTNRTTAEAIVGIAMMESDNSVEEAWYLLEDMKDTFPPEIWEEINEIMEGEREDELTR